MEHEGDDSCRDGIRSEGLSRNAGQVAQTLIGQRIQTEVLLIPKRLSCGLTRLPRWLAAPGTAIGSAVKSHGFARIPGKSETLSGFLDLPLSQQPSILVRLHKGVAGELLERRLAELSGTREQRFDLALLALVGIGSDPCLHASEPHDGGVPAFLQNLRPQGLETVVRSGLSRGEAPART